MRPLTAKKEKKRFIAACLFCYITFLRALFTLTHTLSERRYQTLSLKGSKNFSVLFQKECRKMTEIFQISPLVLYILFLYHRKTQVEKQQS